MTRARATALLILLILLAMDCGRADQRAPHVTASEALDVSQSVAIGKLEAEIRPRVRYRDEADPTFRIRERMSHYRVPGLSIAVIHNHRVAWAKAYGACRADAPATVTDLTLFQGASISKSITALAVMALLRRGVLTLDGDLQTWLKSCKIPNGISAQPHPITLRMILSHTAGLNVESVGAYPADRPVPSLLQILAGVPPSLTPAVRVTEPPGQFHYSGGGLSLVQQMLVDVTGEPFPALMERLVLRPLGMTRSTFAQPLPAPLLTDAAQGHSMDGRPWPGAPLLYPDMAAAGLWTTPSDLAHLVIEVQDAAAGSSGRILDPGLARQMLTPVGHGPAGLGVFVSPDGHRFFHEGWNYGYISIAMGLTAGGDGCVVMQNGEQGILMYEIVDAIRTIWGWAPVSAPRVADRWSHESLMSIAGEYSWKPGGLARIFIQDDRAFLKVSRAPGDTEMEPFPPAELFANGADEVFAIAPSMTLALQRDSKGRVTGLAASGALTGTLPRNP